MRASATKGKDEFPLEVKSGSVSVQICRTVKKNGYTSYTLPFYKEGVRRVRFFQDPAESKREAKSWQMALPEVTPLA